LQRYTFFFPRDLGLAGLGFNQKWWGFVGNGIVFCKCSSHCWEFEEECCIRELWMFPTQNYVEEYGPSWWYWKGPERLLSQEYRTILPGYPKNPARVINL
jgi:hypothetical protein